MDIQKIKTFFKDRTIKFWICFIASIITLLIFLIFLKKYINLINDYKIEALTSTDTWFKRQIYYNIDLLQAKEVIEENVGNAIDTVVNIEKKPFKEYLKDFLIYALEKISQFVNWITSTIYYLILIVQAVFVYILIIFEAQHDKNTKPTIFAKALILMGKYLKKALELIKMGLYYVFRFIKKNKNYILYIICCILFLKGFFFKLVFEIINILINTNPNDMRFGGLEVWSIDLISYLFLLYVVKIAMKHYFINTCIIIIVLLLIIDKRAQKNRAKNVKKFNKFFAEVDLHELGR